MNKWKTSDWCFCEFKLQQIQEVKDNRVGEVSGGMFRLSGYDLSDRCYPLTLRGKRISDEFDMYSDKFHKLDDRSLNYPDINRWLIARWCETMDNQNDDDYIKAKFKELSDFFCEVRDKCDVRREDVVGNVKIFK